MKNRCPHCESARQILNEWIAKQTHDRCWYYPDLFRKLIACLRIDASIDPQLPTRKDFEDGCRRYQDEEYRGSSEGNH